MIPAAEMARSVSDSTYVQICNDIEQELNATKLECQLCRAIRNMRTQYCYKVKSIFGTTMEARGDSSVLRPTLRYAWASVGTIRRDHSSRTCMEGKRALKHAKSPRRECV